MRRAELARYLRAHRPRFVRELGELVAFPSVSSAPRARLHVRRCARWLARHLRALGARDARVIPTAGHPIVVGKIAAAPSARPDRPTVLIYGHYDVQPAPPSAFTPVVAADRLYARGASDAKGQLFAHLKAVELWRAHGGPPVDLVFLIEGEEEIGSPSLRRMLAQLAPYLASDVAVVSDNAVLAADRPSITYGLRGDLYLDVEIRGRGPALHSGNFGGAVHNPLHVLVRALADLHGADGVTRVRGFSDAIGATPRERAFMRRVGPSDRALQREAGGASLVGDGARTSISAYERATIRPSLEIAGITGGYTGDGIRGVIPTHAQAKLDLRLVGDQAPDRVHRQVFDQLARSIPLGLELRTRERMRAAPVVLDRDHPSARAAARAYHRGFGVAPTFVRAGGSIPVVAALADQLAVPTVLMGFALPDDRAHGDDEHYALAMLDKAIATSAAFLEEIADV